MKLKLFKHMSKNRILVSVICTLILAATSLAFIPGKTQSSESY